MNARLRIAPPVILASALLAGCAATTQGDIDPYETANRETHEFNTDVDRALVRPASQVYGTVLPSVLRRGVSNVSDTVGLPGVIANDILQARLDDAGYNLFRFTVNATIGIGGLLDVANAFGLPARPTDFGETLHVWGAGEGPYVVLPVIGPSTTRDAVGLAVDVALNPAKVVFGADVVKAIGPLRAATLVNDRYEYSDIYESVLYDSADSYTVMKLTYLDSRRYTLTGNDPARDTGGEPSADDAANYDLYEDFYD
ncbi:VacJ family lipoprotein [Celeribacter sp.]|uniref:MlaA family lipoprotein n=1 Tax=Celeribacter sp. TaxID=1890673 RepID=UPI003A8FEF84